MTSREELEAVLERLADTEVVRGKHLLASIKPFKQKNIELNNEHLDILARLFVSEGKDKETRDICAAVCWEDNKKDKLLIASNLKEVKGAKEILPKLKNFVDRSTLENYVELVKLVLNNIYFLIQRRSSEGDRQKIRAAANRVELEELRQFKGKILTYYARKGQVSFDQQVVIKEILTLAESASTSLKNSLMNDSSDWEYLVPIDDLNIITNAIVDGKLETELIEAIKADKFEYASGENDEHAEMKIVSKLLELEKKGSYYIGISKLACAPCSVVIKLINESEGQIFLNIGGVHGSTYGKDWKISPKINKDWGEQILGVLRSKLLHEKIKESASKTSEKGLTISSFFSQTQAFQSVSS